MELKEDKVGVTYTKDGEKGWTPAKRRKRKNNCQECEQ